MSVKDMAIAYQRAVNGGAIVCTAVHNNRKLAQKIDDAEAIVYMYANEIRSRMGLPTTDSKEYVLPKAAKPEGVKEH